MSTTATKTVSRIIVINGIMIRKNNSTGKYEALGKSYSSDAAAIAAVEDFCKRNGI